MYILSGELEQSKTCYQKWSLRPRKLQVQMISVVNFSKYLTQTLQENRGMGILPNQLYETSRTLLLKPLKNIFKSKENCRPLSLMNIDTKSFIKHQHLSPITCKKVISNNKVGVMPKMKGCFNSWKPMSGNSPHYQRKIKLLF